MRFARIFFRVFVIGFLSFAAATASLAQSDRGTIAGTVLDASGGAVAGSQVTATGEQTGTVYTSTSGPTGGFRIADVRIGVYRVTVTAAGFKTAEKTGVVVQVNTTSSLEYALQLGDVKETLTVVADASALQADSSDIGTVISAKQIEELPLALNSTGQSHLRSAESFVFLTPGTTGPGTNSDSSSSGIFESKLSGGQNFSTEVILDGASIVHAELGSTFDESAPSIEALDQFKVTTSNVSAEFGRTSGGVESFSTKSGTNAFHGTAFDLLRNDKLNANSWTNNFFGLPKQRDHQNDYGGSLGGPVWIPKLYNGRDKTFFFFSWEQYRNNEGTSNVTTLPTDAERSGDFSALLGGDTGLVNPCDGSAVLKGQIFDPSTTRTVTVGGEPVQCRTAFPGNKIPGGLSAVAQKVLGFLPVHPNVTPTAANLNGLINNFLFSSNKPVLETTMSFRIDHNLGTKSRFFFSYSSRDKEQLNGTPAIPPPLDPNFFTSRFAHYLRFGWDNTISPTMFNHFNVGLNRLNDPSTGESVTGQDWPKVLGIANASGPVFPQIGFGGSPLSIGYLGLSTGNMDIAIPNGLLVADSFLWVRGRHSLRFGFDWRHSQYSRFNNANTSPNYSFSNFQTAFTPNDNLTGDPFASFLLGAPDEESLQVSSVVPRWNQNYYAGYFQDDFKFRKNLTLNLGFRYDVDTPRHEAHGAQSVLDLTAPNSGSASVPISPAVPGALIYGANATGAQTYYKNFGPRLGFAYAPEKLFGRIPQTVIRGGYGIYYAALGYSDFGDSLTNGTTAHPDFASADKFTPVQSPDQGFPTFTLPSGDKDPALQNGGFPTYVAPGYGRPGMTQNWTFEVQHQLAPDLILSVGYVGTHSTRLHSNLQQINSIDPKFFSLGKKLNLLVTDPQGMAALTSVGAGTPPAWFTNLYGSGATVGQWLRPFPQFRDIGTNCCLENVGQSTFNALEAKLERRFRNGLNLLTSYTYSKTLTDADTSFPFFSAFSSGNFGAQTYNNLKAEKGVSFQDIPHTFVLSYLYELPAGPGKKHFSHGVASRVLGGWQVGGVHRYQKGSPTIINSFAPSPNFTGGNFRFSKIAGQSLISSNASSFQILNGADSGCSQNTVQVSPGVFQTTGTWSSNSTNNFFNCAAFFTPNADVPVSQNGYAFGNLAFIYGNIRSPGYVNEDFSIIKRTNLYEAQTLTFKLDIPNAFNRHTFGAIDGNIFSNTFGVPGGGGHNVLNARRQIQITLRYQF